MNNILLIRKALRISQKELAELVGVSAPYIYDLENGNRGATADTWERIARALGCTVEQVQGHDAKGTAK